MKTTGCQILNDVSKSGKRKPWALHKLNSGYIALAYEEIDVKKAERMRDCANYLIFRKVGDSMKLHDAKFCRVRLCPVCQWRRSLKTFAQMSQVLDVASSDHSFIFLTLTIKNCDSFSLSDTLDHLFLSFNRFVKYKDVKKICKGFYRGCEVTHNIKTDTFHPHLHCIFAVNKSYFKSRDYLSQARISQLWQKALRAEYVPVVDVRKCYGGSKSIAEACKYAVKPSDVINPSDWDMTVETLRVLDSALDKRRFVGLGGCIKEIHKQLHLDDVEDGNLINTTNDSESDSESGIEEIIYFWNGYNQYTT